MPFATAARRLFVALPCLPQARFSLAAVFFCGAQLDSAKPTRVGH